MKSLLVLASILSLGLAACGSKVSEEEMKDIARAMGGLSPGTSGSPMAEARAQLLVMKEKAVELHEERVMRMVESDPMPAAATSCTGFEVDGSGCTMSCADVDSSDGTYDVSGECSLGDSHTESCGGTTYKIAGGKLGFGFKVNQSIWSISLSLTGNISGGKLDGELSCKYATSFDFSKPESSSSGESVSCEGFSCTYKGNEIGCEEMQENFGSCEA